MTDEQRTAATQHVPGSSSSSSHNPAAVAMEEIDEESFTFPAMPITQTNTSCHRNKTWQEPVFNVLVARPVTRQEMESSEKGRAAIDKEWNGHRRLGTWDEATVREWRDVSSEAKSMNEKAGKEVIKVHIAGLLEVNVEKNSELPETDERRK